MITRRPDELKEYMARRVLDAANARGSAPLMHAIEFEHVDQMMQDLRDGHCIVFFPCPCGCRAMQVYRLAKPGLANIVHPFEGTESPVIEEDENASVSIVLFK